MSEQLVYALSTLGETRFEKFNDLFKQLQKPLEPEHYELNVRYQTIRYFESLGYCEFDYNQRKVYMCPPALVLMPSFGLPRAVLTGARTPALVYRIKQSIKKRKDRAVVRQFQQKESPVSLPDIIIIESIDRETILEIAKENEINAGVERPAAWDLVDLSSSLADIEEALQFQERADINWKQKHFNIDLLGFSERPVDNNFRLTEYINPHTRQRKHWIWNNNKAADVDRDWGRFLILKAKNKLILSYDHAAQEFQVPLWVPLPCVLARALTLCSGKTPDIQKSIASGGIPENCPLQVYSDVPLEIAKLVADKLEQKVFE